MLSLFRQIWDVQNARGNKGGGYIAARLWWLAFGLNVVNLCLLMPLCFDEEDNGRERGASYAALQQMSRALHLYAQENDGRLPPMDNVPTLRHAVARFITPTPRPVDTLWATTLQHRPYAANPTLGFRPLRAYPHPGMTVALWDTRFWDGGDGKYHQVTFLNGETKFVKQREWKRLRLVSGILIDPPSPRSSWWGRLAIGDIGFAIDNVGFVVNTAFILMPVLSLGAGAAALAASWKDARAWAEARQTPEPSQRDFVWFLLIRLFGYGLCVTAATFVASVFLALVNTRVR